MFWAFVQRIGNAGTMMLIFMVMASLLSPADYGLLGMCYVWITFIKLFSDMGFPAALIQKQNATSEHFSSIFFVNVGFGIILAAAGVLLSWPCAAFFRTKDVQPIMAALSVCFLIDSFATTQRILLQKQLKFRQLATRDIVANIVGGTVGILCALHGFRAWSLVFQTITISVTGTTLLWLISGWRPRIAEFSRNAVKELWGYSSKIMGSEVLKYFTANFDQLIIGHLFGPAALGLYTFALKTAVFPLSEPVKAIDAYLFPKFSMQQNDPERLRNTYYFLLRSASSIMAPLAVIIALSAPFIVPLVFGEKWMNAVMIIQMLCVVGFTYSIITPVATLMKSLNHPGWILIWMISFISVAISFMWAGRHFGLAGSVAGLSATFVVGAVVSYVLATRLLGTKIRSIVEKLIPSLAATLCMGGVLWGMLYGDGKFIMRASSGFPFRLAAGLAVCGILYYVLLRFFDRTVFSEVTQSLVRSIGITAKTEQ